MTRYEWSAFITFETDTTDPKQATEEVEKFLWETNKNPDGPHVFLDDGTPLDVSDEYE